MKAINVFVATLLVLLVVAPGVNAQEMTVDLYLVPIETEGNDRGPKYFCWQMEPPPECIMCRFAMMDYGFTPYGLLAAKDLAQEDRDFLAQQADVFRFPDNLDTAVDQDIQAFFEAIHLPTDWLTPATTWRELLRQVAGIFQFNQRYGGIAAEQTGELHSIFDNADLDTRLREMTDDEQTWFLLTVESFGYDPALISDNSRLRLLVKQAGDYWAAQTFYLGGIEF